MHRSDSLERRASVSLILPAWNEAEVICQAITEADSALRGIASTYEIIVVDDGSTDQTAALVESMGSKNESIKLIRHCPNQGYGAALRSGFAAAEKDLVVFTDADCQFDLSELDRFTLLAKRYEVVCGYRIDRKDTPLRCLYSRVYNQLVRVLLRTGVRDVDCALKMFHRNVIQNLKIGGDGFLVNSEILTQVRMRRHSLVEVGVSHRPRMDGTSTVSIAHIPSVLLNLVGFWWSIVRSPSDTASPPQRTTLSYRFGFAASVCALVSLPMLLGIGWLMAQNRSSEFTRRVGDPRLLAAQHSLETSTLADGRAPKVQNGESGRYQMLLVVDSSVAESESFKQLSGDVRIVPVNAELSARLATIIPPLLTRQIVDQDPQRALR